MDLTTALEFAGTTRQAVLVTLRRDGKPQLSNILHKVGDDGIIRISITADRAKYKNLVREPWAALHVTRPDFFAYAVIEGDVSLSPIATGPGDPGVDALVELYRSLAGEHEDWDAYRASMVADRRSVVSITPTRAYGMCRSHSDATDTTPGSSRMRACTALGDGDVGGEDHERGGARQRAADVHVVDVEAGIAELAGRPRRSGRARRRCGPRACGRPAARRPCGRRPSRCGPRPAGPPGCRPRRGRRRGCVTRLT